MGFGIGQPTERELMCLDRARLWESLIPFALLFEDSVSNQRELAAPAKKKPAKPEYDWRVIVANAQRRADHARSLA